MRRSSDYLRLYLVTDRDLARGRPLADVVARAVRGGVTAVQLREKTIGARRFLAEVVEIKGLLAGTGVPVFVNDRVDVAIAAGADGMHVGQDDLPAADARRLIGPGMLLGVSVATPEEARAALAAGADYVSVAAVFLNPNKPDAEHAVGLQRREKRLERELGCVRRTITRRHPVVDVAKRHHEIGGARRRDRKLVRKPEGRDRHAVVDCRGACELRAERFHLARLVRKRGALAVEGGVKLAALAQHGREDVRVPTAARPDLDDGHVGAQPEELERLLGMPIAVAGLGRGAAMRPGERRIERRVRGLLRLRFEKTAPWNNRPGKKRGDEA